jgi:hypothetical protein
VTLDTQNKIIDHLSSAILERRKPNDKEEIKKVESILNALTVSSPYA